MRALHTTQFPEAGPEMLSSYGTVNEFGFIANPASASLTSYYNITTVRYIHTKVAKTDLLLGEQVSMH
ncbi:hypothetical protein Plhal304r1_c070g0159121 [Plasmopara halstedii]